MTWSLGVSKHFDTKINQTHLCLTPVERHKIPGFTLQPRPVAADFPWGWISLAGKHSKFSMGKEGNQSGEGCMSPHYLTFLGMPANCRRFTTNPLCLAASLSVAVSTSISTSRTDVGGAEKSGAHRELRGEPDSGSRPSGPACTHRVITQTLRGSTKEPRL